MSQPNRVRTIYHVTVKRGDSLLLPQYVAAFSQQNAVAALEENFWPCEITEIRKATIQEICENAHNMTFSISLTL